MKRPPRWGRSSSAVAGLAFLERLRDRVVVRTYPAAEQQLRSVAPRHGHDRQPGEGRERQVRAPDRAVPLLERDRIADRVERSLPLGLGVRDLAEQPGVDDGRDDLLGQDLHELREALVEGVPVDALDVQDPHGLPRVDQRDRQLGEGVRDRDEIGVLGRVVAEDRRPGADRAADDAAIQALPVALEFFRVDLPRGIAEDHRVVHGVVGHDRDVVVAELGVDRLDEVADQGVRVQLPGGFPGNAAHGAEGLRVALGVRHEFRETAALAAPGDEVDGQARQRGGQEGERDLHPMLKEVVGCRQDGRGARRSFERKGHQNPPRDLAGDPA